jgi:EAL domain-containing protein (putative c-di-GMP-specific phosphodiesterase class I)
MYYRAEDDLQATVQRKKLQAIRYALDNNEFQLYYQPKVNMVTGKVLGAEALIRWIHPEEGVIPPLDFLPVLDGTDLEIELGNWVVEQALNQLDDFLSKGIKLEISVNISSFHLQSANFVHMLEMALEQHPKVNSRCLQLEILESSTLSDVSAIRNVIHMCRDGLGVHVSLDDFGTGYSSLTHLRNLPVDTIKIDQSFVRNMLDDPQDYTIVDGVIGLSSSFHRDVIAEGVETTEHGLMLVLMGCELAQGYGVARPMPIIDFEVWLTNYTPNASWLKAGTEPYSIKKTQLAQFQLCANHWKTTFQSQLASQGHGWPIMDHKKCLCGRWIQVARQSGSFDDALIDSLDQDHEHVHLTAKQLMVRRDDRDNSVTDISKLEQAFQQMQTNLDKLLN